MDEEIRSDPEAVPCPLSLDEVRARFESWRATKPRRNSPIPEELWAAAIGLIGPQCCPADVSRVLGLDTSRLMTKLAGQPKAGPGGTPVALPVPVAKADHGSRESRPPRVPAFVEMAIHAVTPPGAAASAFDPRHDPRVIIEMRLPDGTSLKVSQREPIDAAGLVLDLLAARR